MAEIGYMTRDEMNAQNDNLDESFVVEGALTKCNAAADQSVRVKLIASKDTHTKIGYATQMLSTDTKEENFEHKGKWYGNCKNITYKPCDPNFLDEWVECSKTTGYIEIKSKIKYFEEIINSARKAINSVQAAHGRGPSAVPGETMTGTSDGLNDYNRTVKDLNAIKYLDREAHSSISKMLEPAKSALEEASGHSFIKTPDGQLTYLDKRYVKEGVNGPEGTPRIPAPTSNMQVKYFLLKKSILVCTRGLSYIEIVDNGQRLYESDSETYIKDYGKPVEDISKWLAINNSGKLGLATDFSMLNGDVDIIARLLFHEDHSEAGMCGIAWTIFNNINSNDNLSGKSVAEIMGYVYVQWAKPDNNSAQMFWDPLGWIEEYPDSWYPQYNGKTVDIWERAVNYATAIVSADGDPNKLSDSIGDNPFIAEGDAAPYKVYQYVAVGYENSNKDYWHIGNSAFEASERS
jgi:hypothetical protein